MEDSTSQFDGDLTPCNDLLELQRLLHVPDSVLQFDGHLLSSVISKDLKAALIQTHYRSHMVTPSSFNSLKFQTAQLLTMPQGRARRLQLERVRRWLITTGQRMQWPCSLRTSSSTLSCITFVNSLLALIEQACISTNDLCGFKSAYSMFCNYLLPSDGLSARCVWSGSSTAHAAADFCVLCKIALPSDAFGLFHRFNSSCLKLQAVQRGHLIRKTWQLGPGCYRPPSPRSSHATQQLASQAISAAALQVALPPISSLPHGAVSIPKKLSAAAFVILAAHRAWHSTAMTEASLAGALPVHPAGLLRFPKASVCISGLGGVELQKAIIELRLPAKRISRFLRGCTQRQISVVVAAAMSFARRASSRTADLQSLELYPMQFPMGISRILLKGFSSGLKLHSAVRALLSDMRSNLATASLLLRQSPLRHSNAASILRRKTNVIAICASSLPQLRLPSRSVASFVRLQFCQDMPRGHSRLHTAPLAHNPGITRNQQIAALCFGQPLAGGWRNDKTHAQWLQSHWSGLAVAGALYALQDSQLVQLIATVDRVLMADEAKSKAATHHAISAAQAAEGIAVQSHIQSCRAPALRDAASEFLTLCARVAGRRPALFTVLPPLGTRDRSSPSTPAIYLQSSLLLFNDLSNNFLLQLTQRQRCLLVTMASLEAFQILVAVVHIQRCTRGRSVRRIVNSAKQGAGLQSHVQHQNDAATRISRCFRLHRSRCKFRGSLVLRLQRFWRGHVVRKVLNKVAIRVQIENAAAERVQRHWRGRISRRWFGAACIVLRSRLLLRGREKDAAIDSCVQSRSCIWSDPSIQRQTDFVSGLCCKSLFPFLLNNQRQWVAASLLRQRNALLNSQSHKFASFMAKALSEAESICMSQLCRAWKRHNCKKLVRLMVQTLNTQRLLASRRRASALLQRAWRGRWSRLKFCSALTHSQLAKQQRSSGIIVRSVLCFRSRRLLRLMRRGAAACTLQRRFRVHTAASRMAAHLEAHHDELLLLRREVAAVRLQAAERGWASRRKCLCDAPCIASHMLAWNALELPYDSRLRLAIVIARHRPYVCSNKRQFEPSDAESLYTTASRLAPFNSVTSLLRRVALSSCSCAGNSIAEWAFKRIRKERNRCRILAQFSARQAFSALLLQAVYRSHLHRRKHFKPLLPGHRAAVMQRRRAAAATRIQSFWRSSVARLALACLSAAAMRGRWMTRTRWAHSRAKQALLPPHPPAVERADADRLPATSVPEWTFFDAKLNGWCFMPLSLAHSALSPDDGGAINTAISASFHLCGRIEGFVGASPSSDRFFGGDSKVASLLQQIERVCPQLTSRCWDSVCSAVPKDAAAFAADPALSSAHAIISYLRQFVSAMLSQTKSSRERDAVLFSLRSCSHAAGVRAAFVVHLPPAAAKSLRLMLLHSCAAVISSMHWLFTRWGNAELMGSCHTGSSFMFPCSHDAEFVHECHGVWGALLQCHVRPILFCLEMLVSSMNRQLFERLFGADAALVCSAISALLMLMSFWLQTSLNPQHPHGESSLWLLYSACSLESKYMAAYLEESLRRNAPSIRLNIIQLLHAAVHEHMACASAALGQQSESLASLMRAEKLLQQLSSSSISSWPQSQSLHGPPSPSELLCWRELAQSSALLFDCFGGKSAPSQAEAWQ